MTAAERAREEAWALRHISFTGNQPDIEAGGIDRIADLLTELAERLEAAERERDVLLESEAEWQRRGDRSIAAESLNAELVEALSRCASMAGHPDPAQACRNIIALVKEEAYLEARYEKLHREGGGVSPG